MNAQPALEPLDADAYCEGRCHELAVALHRLFGWELLLVTDPNDPYWQDPEDDDNFIPSVVHVYAVDPAGNAWDAFGVRPADHARSDCEERFVIKGVDTDWLRHEDELQTYVGEWGDPDIIDRPLFAYTDLDIDRAWADAQRFLAHVPGWPLAPSMGPSRKGPGR